MLKIIITAAALSILALADGPVLKTGQVKSYGICDIVVTDGSISGWGQESNLKFSILANIGAVPIHLSHRGYICLPEMKMIQIHSL